MKQTFTRLISIALSASLFVPALAFAQSGVGASVQATTTVKITASLEAQRTRGTKEIDRRIQALTSMMDRVGELKRLSEEARTSIVSSLNAQISALTNLKAKVAADTDATVLKEDIKSITDSYRIFALVLPQGRIIIMADTVVYVADAYIQLGTKLSQRVSAAKAAGNNTAAAEASLNTMAEKINDAKSQAQASINLIAGLVPDEGDKTKMAANAKALADAKAKLKVSHNDLKAARAEAVKIMNALKTMKASASGSASTTNSQ